MKDEKEFNALLENLNEKNLEQYAKKHLSAQKQRKLSEILHDDKKLNAILNSEQAKKIVKQLKDKRNG
ncbi:MAG: hypothetical protein IKE65_09250 [Clostridia bacterium]|nr:hypothetical protein [Clostridia bacterium]